MRSSLARVRTLQRGVAPTLEPLVLIVLVREFSNPIGVTVDSAGNVYVADEFNNRVELFSDPTTSATIALVTGWNLISLPLVPSNTAIRNLLAGLIAGHNLTIVWSYQGGVWKSFTPPATGTLKTMQDGFGYWIYVTHPGTLYVLGFVIFPRVGSAQLLSFRRLESAWVQTST